MRQNLSEIQLSKSALRHNIGEFRRLLPQKTKLIAVVKANAYGHGLKEIVRIANSQVDAFQVDDIEELRAVREITKKPIFVFGYVPSTSLEELVMLQGILGVYTVEAIHTLEQICKKRNKKIKIHIKIDAFLGRQGVFLQDIEPMIHVLRSSSHITLEALYSHFSNIEDTNGLDHAKKQHEYLLQVKEKVIKLGFTSITHHISATSGFLSEQQTNWGGSYVRIGIGMYGLWPSESLKRKFEKNICLKPVLRWCTKVAQIKNVPKNFPIGYGLSYITKKSMTIAVIPQGYSDGYDRRFSNQSSVLIRGSLCKVLGRIAMNMFVVDVSRVKDLALEDEAVLLGEQERGEITAEQLVHRSDSINYEILARISPLLPRVIIE